MLKRMNSRETPDKGGYNAFCTYSAGVTQLNPSAHNSPPRRARQGHLRAGPRSPKLEELRDAWLVAPDPAAQKEIGIEMQRQAFIDVPYVPLGVFYQPTAYKSNDWRAPRPAAVLERAARLIARASTKAILMLPITGYVDPLERAPPARRSTS